MKVKAKFIDSDMTDDTELAAGIAEAKAYTDSALVSYVTKDLKIVHVAKSGGDFTSVKDAMDSITDSSETNPYRISIGPGIFTEDQITFKEYVFVNGSGDRVSVIQANNPNQHLIIAKPTSGLANVTLTGATGSGYALVYLASTNVTSTTEVFSLNNVNFGSADILAYAEGVTIGAASNIYIGESSFGGAYSYNHAFLSKVTTGSSARVLVRASNTKGSIAPHPTMFASAEGNGAEIVLNAVQTRNGASTGTALYASDGGRLRLSSVNVRNWAVGMEAANVGIAPVIKATAISFEDCTQDIIIAHPDTSGNFSGTASTAKVTVTPDSPMAIFFTDPLVAGTTIMGKLLMGPTHVNTVNVAPLIHQGSAMGVFSGGKIHHLTGVDVEIESGFGYHKREDVNGTFVILKEWDTFTYTVPFSLSTQYIYFNNDGILSYSMSLPDTTENLLLGRISVGYGDISFIENTPVYAAHIGNLLDGFIRDGLGAIYASGSLVTENGTRGLNVAPGKYFFAENKFTPSGATGLNWVGIYRNGSGFGATQDTQVNNTDYNDIATGLVPLTTDYYAKHSLYLVGDGTEEKYFMIYGQEQFSALTLAEQGNLPLPPQGFEESVVLIASIIVRQGTTNIVQIRDERPIIGNRVGMISAATTHSNLLGLGGDDHQQYLRVDGGRAMSGSLNMNSNQITNAGNINGINLSTHAARHLPNGLDPIATGIASTIGVTNGAGVANTLSRQDHIHAHGNQTTPTHHAVATQSANGFMSSVDKTKLDNALGRIVFPLVTAGTAASNTTYTLVGTNYVWMMTSGTTLIKSGNIKFYATVSNRNLQVRVVNVDTGAILGTSDVISVTGYYLVDIVLPTTDCRIGVQILKTSTGGSNPSLEGVQLSFETI